MIRDELPFALLALGIVLSAACTATGAQDGARSTNRGLGEESTMELKSPAFEPNGTIPVEHTCEGEDVSPPLQWSGVPDGTKSFALIMDDPDAPPGTWVHWVLYDLPGDRRELAEALPKTETLPDGAAQGKCWGVERFSRVGYHGPCPPPGKPHRYVFRLYALDSELQLQPGAPKAEVEGLMRDKILAQAELTGLFGR